MPLSTLPAFKAAVGVVGADQDVFLQQLLDAADAAVHRYCGRASFLSADYVEFYSGSGAPELMLRHRPVVSVESVHLDPVGYFGDSESAFAEGTRLESGVGYALDRGVNGLGGSGLLIRLGGGTGFGDFDRPLARRRPSVWPEGIGNVRVAYRAGYATIPDDLRHACNQLAAWMYISVEAGGSSPRTEKLGSYMYSFDSGGAASAIGSVPELGSTAQLLAPFKEMAL